MCVIAMGLTGVATFLPVFGSERIVYWREASALPQPLHTLAYFIGKDLAMLPQVWPPLTSPMNSLGVYW